MKVEESQVNLVYVRLWRDHVSLSAMEGVHRLVGIWWVPEEWSQATMIISSFAVGISNYHLPDLNELKTCRSRRATPTNSELGFSMPTTNTPTPRRPLRPTFRESEFPSSQRTYLCES
jgi:hypothetical protein